ncbi:MAG: DUF1292 domain-containing protein [Clostridia bacterium]|nr:DUF1292 domain-containing protein [Clostridia bacterium]
MSEIDNIIELVDENGETVEFEHLMTFEHEGKTYIAMMPAGEEEAEEGEVVLLAIAEDENGEECYVTLEDEAEAEAAFTRFLQLIEEMDEEE